MDHDDVDDVAENIRILIHEELDTQHRLDGHSTPVPACPICRAHDSSRPRQCQVAEAVGLRC